MIYSNSTQFPSFDSLPTLHEFAENPFKFLDQFPKRIDRFQEKKTWNVPNLTFGSAFAFGGVSTYIMGVPKLVSGVLLAASVVFFCNPYLIEEEETWEYRKTAQEINELFNPFINQFKEAHRKKMNHIYNQVNDVAVDRLIDAGQQIDNAIRQYEELKNRDANWGVFKQDARAIMSIPVDTRHLDKMVKEKALELQEAASLFINGVEERRLGGNTNYNYVEYAVLNRRIKIIQDELANW
jgi:hypothetical protein